MRSENPQGKSIDAPHAKSALAPRRKHKCMYRDEKGFWWIDYYNPSGQRRRKKAGKTKADADRLLHSIRGAINSGDYVDPSRSPSFRAFVDTFMERHGNHKISYLENRHTIKRLKDFFGETKLTRINASHIEQYRLLRRGEKSANDNKSPLSPSTINREVEIIRSMLSKAVRWNFLGKNPACQVEDYDEDNKRERFLSNEEMRRLLRATKKSNLPILRAAVYLALQTGMRKGELLNLRWTDINFESRQILVRDTKTGLPRHVPLSRRAVWLLRKRAALDPLATWIFETKGEDGLRAAAKDTKTAWYRSLRLAGIDNFHFHDLRHTFASHYCMAGGNIYALAKVLGHANASMTLGRYAHLSPQYINEQRLVMDRMNSNRQQMDSKAASAGT